MAPQQREQRGRHFGEVPGFPEGHLFATRMELSQSGVHRPPQSGICGTPAEGAESVILTGGYEDDEDEGDVILYTGHGGNDRKSRAQVADQHFAEQNLALARSAVLGLPVRVVRGAAGQSPWSPAAGYAYAGLYRVDGYWRDTGKSGFLIWRFRLVKIGAEAPARVGAVREGPAGYDAGGGDEGPPPRTRVTISRVVRDSEAARAVKRMHDFSCQVCGTRLETPAGPYAEAAHVRPLGRPHDGPDTTDNLLCLCPNCHVLFDLGAITVEDDGRVSGTSQPLRQARGHAPDPAHLRYHRGHIGGGDG